MRVDYDFKLFATRTDSHERVGVYFSVGYTDMREVLHGDCGFSELAQNSRIDPNPVFGVNSFKSILLYSSGRQFDTPRSPFSHLKYFFLKNLKML